MNEKAQAICDAWFQNGCRKSCPLSAECELRHGETREDFEKRMNAAADAIKP